MEAKYIHEFAASQVSVTPHPENQTATFEFLDDNNNGYLMTIPLRQLESLHQYVSERLSKDPTLFALKIKG